MKYIKIYESWVFKKKILTDDVEIVKSLLDKLTLRMSVYLILKLKLK